MVEAVGEETGYRDEELGTEMDRENEGGSLREGGGDGLDWRMWERSSLAVGRTRAA